MFTIKKPNREEAKLYHQFYKELFGFEDAHIGMNFDTLNKENDIDKKIYQELNVDFDLWLGELLTNIFMQFAYAFAFFFLVIV